MIARLLLALTLTTASAATNVSMTQQHGLCDACAPPSWVSAQKLSGFISAEWHGNALLKGTYKISRRSGVQSDCEYMQRLDGLGCVKAPAMPFGRSITVRPYQRAEIEPIAGISCITEFCLISADSVKFVNSRPVLSLFADGSYLAVIALRRGGGPTSYYFLVSSQRGRAFCFYPDPRYVPGLPSTPDQVCSTMTRLR